MSFVIRQISLTADGREIVRSVTLAKPQLSLGRASTNDIHLPDLALEPDHARIEQIDARTIRVRATGTLGFDVEGRTTRSADIDTSKGAELRFGGHRVTVAQEDDATVLAVRRIDAVSEASEEKEEARVFSLARLAPPKRLTAWALALAEGRRPASWDIHDRLAARGIAGIVVPKRISKTHVWLKGVHPDYLADLPEWPGEK